MPRSIDESFDKSFQKHLTTAEAFCSKLGFTRIRPEKSVIIGLNRVHVHVSDAWFVTFEGAFYVARPTTELRRIMPEVNKMGIGDAEYAIVDAFFKGKGTLETAWKAGHRAEEYLIFALTHGIKFSDITQCSPLILDSLKHLNFPHSWDRASSTDKENRALAIIYATQMTNSLEEAKEIISLAPASWVAKALTPKPDSN